MKKVFARILIVIYLVAIFGKYAAAEGTGSEIKIVQATDATNQIQGKNHVNEAGNNESLNDENARPEHVSKYGTFQIIQLPLMWMGKLVDGVVFGIGKVGTAAIAIVKWPVEAIQGKRKGGPHGEEKNKKS